VSAAALVLWFAHCSSPEGLRDTAVTVVDWKEERVHGRAQFCGNSLWVTCAKPEAAAVKIVKDACKCTILWAEGMGFIVSNESVLAFNNTKISMNVLEVAPFGVKDFSTLLRLSSTAKQEDPANLESPTDAGRHDPRTCTAWRSSTRSRPRRRKRFADNICVARFINICWSPWKSGREDAAPRRLLPYASSTSILKWGFAHLLFTLYRHRVSVPAPMFPSAMFINLDPRNNM
jgi:hypothetical protein